MTSKIYKRQGKKEGEVDGIIWMEEDDGKM